MAQRRAAPVPGDTHFDAVIVGSGFGGSVSAYRLAKAGQRVCVLERGKAYPPGSFPRRPRVMAANFWDPSQGRYGLFNVWSFRGIEAVVSSGLGGGSLIYANVLMRKDKNWFVKQSPFDGGYEHWPIDLADLEPHYDEVERMLGAQRYPFETAGYPNVPKTGAMQGAAQGLNLEWGLANPAVTFANGDGRPVQGEPVDPAPYPNLHGAQSASPADCAGNATSAATTAARTPWTIRICQPPSTTGPTSACSVRCGGSHPGPVITSFIRTPDSSDPGGTDRGFYIEDAGYPTFLDWMLEAITARSTVSRLVRFALRRIRARLTGNPASDLSGEIGNLIGPATLSSGSLPLLGMDRDIPDGVMRLRRGISTSTGRPRRPRPTSAGFVRP